MDLNFWSSCDGDGDDGTWTRSVDVDFDFDGDSGGDCTWSVDFDLDANGTTTAAPSCRGVHTPVNDSALLLPGDTDRLDDKDVRRFS